MRKIIILFTIILYLSSCNEWLNVRPNMEIDKDELYKTENGFKSALAGCYIKLKNQDLYGRSLTMTTIESLAQHWDYADNTTEYYLSNYDYENSSVEQSFARIYEKLYNIIVQLNEIIDYADKNKNIFLEEKIRQLIVGEAYAMRAFCHLDILRLWGPVPTLVQKNDAIGLAYVTKVTKDKIERDTWSSYTQKLEKDFIQASELLAESDPIMKKTFADASKSETLLPEYEMYRQFRFNYYGVEALKARFYLYIQMKPKALEAAMKVINATATNKQPTITLTGHEDISSNKPVSPSEHLVSLSIFNMKSYVDYLFSGNNPIHKSLESISNDLFQNSVNDVRYLSLWTELTNSVSGTKYNVLRKYWQNPDASDKMVSITEQMVPLIRFSEVYLIAMECANIEEANILAKDYFYKKHIIYDEFTDDNQRLSIILSEYNKELYAEGQLFFNYKRIYAQNIMWYNFEMNEINYTIPLPKTDRIN